MVECLPKYSIMKRIFIVVLSVFCFGVSAQDWITVKDMDLSYRIDFPQGETKSSQDVPTEKGNVKMILYSGQPASAEDKNVYYATSFSEYPVSFFPNGLNSKTDIDSVLEGAMNGAVSNVKGKLMSK